MYFDILQAQPNCYLWFEREIVWHHINFQIMPHSGCLNIFPNTMLLWKGGITKTKESGGHLTFHIYKPGGRKEISCGFHIDRPQNCYLHIYIKLLHMEGVNIT